MKYLKAPRRVDSRLINEDEGERRDTFRQIQVLNDLKYDKNGKITMQKRKLNYTIFKKEKLEY